MSGGHALVSGRDIANAKNILTYLDGMGLGTNYLGGEYLYPMVDDLVDAMIKGVASQYDMLTSILILDYAFIDESDIGSCIEEFLEVQDILNQYNMRKVKLYLVTKNDDLYDRIRQNYKGRDILVYPNTEVFLTKKFQLSYIDSVLRGSKDGLGLRPKKKSTLTRIERIEKEKQQLEEDAKQVERETLEYEKYIPQSRLDREDYIDTAKAREKQAQLEKERNNLIRRAERLELSYYVDEWGDVSVYDENNNRIEDIDAYERELRNQRRGDKSTQTPRKRSDIELERQSAPVEDNTEEQGYGGYTEYNQEEEDLFNRGTPTPPEPQIRRRNTGGRIDQTYPVGRTSSAKGRDSGGNYTPFQEKPQTSTYATGGNERAEGVNTLKVLFDDLLSDGMNLVEDKLHDDSVVMAVSSTRGSGGSGLTAQIAEVYAMLGRKVCIIDLDVNGRGQTYYFNNYDQRVAENKGLANALINVVEGGVINKASVSVNSRIDVCGISSSIGTISDRYKETIARNLNSTLIDAREFYDIVLLDLPIEDFSLYMDKGFSNVERFLFVTENKEHEVERLFRQYLSEFVESNGLLVSDIFNNATIVLNKYSNTSRDEQGFHINKQWLKEKLYAKGAPYDAILVSGEIPYTRNFEEQTLTNQRYVWQDSGYMATVKNMLKDAV